MSLLGPRRGGLAVEQAALPSRLPPARGPTLRRCPIRPVTPGRIFDAGSSSTIRSTPHPVEFLVGRGTDDRLRLATHHGRATQVGSSY